MANIITSFNTQTKAFSVAIDDKKIKNVSAVEFYGLGDDKAYCEITTVEAIEEEKVVKVTRIAASEEDDSIETSASIDNEDNSELFDFIKNYRQ